MVSTSTKPKVDSVSPTTRCTNCQTVFELPPELLNSVDTRVRCGECLCIFDAKAGLLSPVKSRGQAKAEKAGTASRSVKSLKMPAASPSMVEDSSALDVTYSDFDLFSEEADLPALAYLDETRDTPEFDFDSVELGDEETFSDTLFAHDVTIDADLPISDPASETASLSADLLARLPRAEVDFTVDKTPETPLVFEYTDPPERKEPKEPVDEVDAATTATQPGRIRAVRSKGQTTDTLSVSAPMPVDELLNEPEDDLLSATDTAVFAEAETAKSRSGLWVWGVGSVLLVCVLAATLLYPRWASLDQSPTFRPYKVALCNVIGCEVQTRVDIDQLQVLKREMAASRERENAIVITIAIRNNADFAQRYPVVEPRMTNRVGRVVAQRAFRPADYLPSWSRGDEFGAGETITINLTVNDPGTAAEDHVLQLRELRLDCKPLVGPNGQARWPADCAQQ